MGKDISRFKKFLLDYILKTKNDEEIEADKFVRRDYVCKNELVCFLLNFSSYTSCFFYVCLNDYILE